MAASMISLASLGIGNYLGYSDLVGQVVNHYGTHVNKEAEAKSQLNFEEHLRRQPSHLTLDFESQLVAYVKRESSGAFQSQRFIVSYSSSRLIAKAEGLSELLAPKMTRTKNRRSMKEAWVRLQTGAAPKLITQKPTSSTEWVDVPIVTGAQAREDGSSPSWLEVARVLGLHVPSQQGFSIHGSSHNGGQKQAPGAVPVPVPVAVLFALMAAGAQLGVPLEFTMSKKEGCSTMSMDKIQDSFLDSFSRELNSPVVFKVTSCWQFAAMLD